MIGTVVAGRFKLERQAGVGGMGTVYQARDLTDGAPVALKILTDTDVRNAERFEQEAAILAGLNHPGIVRYVARGLIDGRHFLAMEWLEGQALDERIEQRPLTLGDSLIVVRRTAEALAYAHERGVIHRDIKPENLFLPGGRLDALKLLDFGVARLARAARRLTRTGFLVGTPGYLAPEIISGAREVTAAADFFALGCVAFRCLTGRNAFEGEDPGQLMAKIVLGEAPRVTEVAPLVPNAVSDFVAALMERDPHRRPGDAASILRTLSTLEAIPDQGPGYGARRATTSLTLTEQRLVCLVMVGPVPGLLGLLEAEEPVVPRALDSELRATFEAGVHGLPDGSLVITLPASGKITDLAMAAARAALVARRHVSGAPIAVVSGQARGEGGPGWSAVIDAAARLLRDTRPGQIRLQEVVGALVDARFDLAREGEVIILQGERELALAHRKLLGKSIDIVGRNRELASLAAMLATAVEESSAQAAVVVGPAGMGKSRLLEEFLDTVRRQPSPPRILFGAGDPVGAGSPFAMLARVLRRHAGISDGEPVEESRRKLAALAPFGGDPVRATFLGEIARVPFPDEVDQSLRAARANPQLMGDGMRRAFEDWLRAECDARPVLLLLDDLHWGDSATVGFIDAALRNLRDSPLMVLALARPEVEESFPDLWQGRGLQQIALGPLSRKAAEKLVREAMGPDAAADLVAELAVRSDGNPFYLEELVRAADAGRAHALPDTVLATVQARLDAEGEDAKRVLRAASVFGARFSAAGVAALVGGEAALAETVEWLHRLVDREILGHSQRAGGEEELAFAHALIRDAAYATLTDEDRALGHRLAGGWLEGTAFPDPMSLAEHFRRGGELGRSVRWYREGAEQALRASDLAGALSRVELGLQAIAASAPDGDGDGDDGTDETSGVLNLIAAEAHLWRGEFPQAEARGTRSLPLLPRGTPLWYRAVAQTVISLAKQGKVDAVSGWAAQAMAAPPAAESAAAVNAFINCVAWTATFLVLAGCLTQAAELQQRAETLMATLAEPDAQSRALVAQAQAIAASVRGDLDGFRLALEAALAHFEQAGDARNAATVRSNIGFLYAELGLYQRAEETLAKALTDADRIGLAELPAVVRHNLGRVRARRGDLAEGQRLELAAIGAFVVQGEPRLEGLARTYLSEIVLAAGDPLEAERQAVAALDLLKVAPSARVQAMAALARAYLVQGRKGDSLAVARQAAGELERLGTVDEGDAEVRLVLAEALAAAGRADEARAALRHARVRLLERAARMADAEHRRHFLTDIEAHARTLALAVRDDGAEVHAEARALPPPPAPPPAAEAPQVATAK